MKPHGWAKRDVARGPMVAVAAVVALNSLQAAEVRGRVVDGRGVTVAGAVVAAEQKGYLLTTARTDAAGRYVLADLLDAPTRVSVRYPGEPPLWCAPVRALSEAEVGEGARVDFAGQKGVLLTARFISTVDGKPVREDIEVQCDGGAGFQATPVNEDGTIHYRTPPGRVTLIPRCVGDFRRHASGGRYGARYPCRDFMVRSDHSVDLRVRAVRLGSAVVRVVGPDGQPVSEATVAVDATLRTVTARTDREGIAHLERVPRNFSLYAQAPTAMFAQYANVQTAPDSPPAMVQLVRTVEREVRFVDDKGDPIDGVTARFHCSDIFVRQTRSDSSGVARAPVLPGHRYAVEWALGPLGDVTSLEDFRRDPKTRKVLEDEPPPETVIILGRHSLSGEVVDEAGRPVPNGYVTVDTEGWPRSMRGSRYAKADDKGRFTLHGLPGGKVTLIAYWWRPPNAISRASAPMQVDSTAGSVRPVVLPLEPVDITVWVVGPRNQAIVGARVEVYSADAIQRAAGAYEDSHRLTKENRPISTAITSHSGAAVLGSIDSISFELVVTKPGWSVAGRRGNRWSPRREFTLVLEEPIALEGRVRMEDGNPVPGAEVLLQYAQSQTPNAGLRAGYCEPPELRTTTDANGRFVLHGLPQRVTDGSVLVRLPGYREVWAAFRNINDIVLKKSDALESAITGRVLDETAGKPGSPAEGVAVICRGQDGSAQRTITGADGRYRFGNLWAQRYDVWLQSPAAEPGKAGLWTCARRWRVTVPEEKTVEDIDFTLIEGVVVSGRILGVDGEGMPRLTVSLGGEFGRSSSEAQADAEGRWACRLAPGKYYPRVAYGFMDFRWREENRELIVSADEPMTDIDFHLIPEEPPRRPGEKDRGR